MSCTRWATIVLVVAVAACGPADETQEIEPLEDAQPTTTMTAAAADTTAASLWAHLQNANYRSWRMWPGKAALYTGTEPHGMLLTTYVNDLAHDALTSGAATMPSGAIIVKENYMPDSTFAAATVMHKVSGYDTQNGDWFWAKYDPNGVPEDAGRIAMCQQCHGGARQRDYLLTALPQN